MTTEGRFNPSDHLIQLPSKTGPKDYLPVAWRIAWFRDLHPEGIITTELVEHDAAVGRAMFKATVVRRTEESEGSATGHGSETVGDFGDYVEKAETKAVGRALAMLGFGTQFCDDFDEGGAVTDSPLERKAASPKRVAPNPTAPAPVSSAEDYRQMDLKYAGACEECGWTIQVKETAQFNLKTRKVRHLPGECPPAPDETQQGGAEGV